MKLTISLIRKAIKGNPKIDQEIDIVEDTVGIWTNHGYAWHDDRHVEVVRIGDFERDTLSYLKTCIKNIVEDRAEA